MLKPPDSFTTEKPFSSVSVEYIIVDKVTYMSSIYLVRHGIPDFPNGNIILQGRYTDLDLNPGCFSDAANLKDYFADKEIENWYSSPLKRARQSLEQFIPDDKKMIILEDAAEVYFGRWEGKSWEENMRNDPDLFERRKTDNTVLPPGAEDMRDAAKRMMRALKQTQGNCVIATHWTVISLVTCLLTGHPFEDYTSIPHPYLGVTKINRKGEEFTVEFVGRKVCDTPFCDTWRNY